MITAIPTSERNRRNVCFMCDPLYRAEDFYGFQRDGRYVHLAPPV
jgi:hypothetical protein